MCRFILGCLIAITILAGCSSEYPQADLDDNEDAGYTSGQQTTEIPPDQLEFTSELRERGSLITAAFDFEEFSVWFTVTPGYVHMDLVGAYVWHILHPARPTTAAVVRNVNELYVLVEEVDVDFRFQPVDWENNWYWLRGIPDSIPHLGNQHLVQREGYRVSDLQADIFLAGPAVAVHTDEQMILIYSGLSGLVRPIHQLVFTRDGITANHTLETISAQPEMLLRDIENLTFSLQTGVLTLESDVYTLNADINGITETMGASEIQHHVDGNLIRFDELLGLSPIDMRDALMWESSVPVDLRFPVVNGRIYHFQWLYPGAREETVLRQDSFDLASNTHIRDRIIHDFGAETVLYQSFAARGLTIYTDAAAYLFDRNFELLHRRPWPGGIDIERLRERWTLDNIALNDDFTKLAFAGTINNVNGLFLFDLSAGTAPTLLVEQQPISTEWGFSQDLLEFSSPVQFLDNERLFVSVAVWTGWAFFRLVDFDGNILEEFPFGATGAYGGGFAFTNSAMVIFEPQDPEQGPHYYDFSSGILSPADWWWRSENEFWSAYIPDPNNPRVWYVSSVTPHTGRHQVGLEERSSILRLDFERKSVTPLLTMTGMSLTLISVSQSGELVFAYSGQSGSGFAVFAPQ